MGWLEWLQGRKTWIVFFVGVIFNGGILAGWWTLDSQLWVVINTILGFLGLGSINAKMNRNAKGK